MSCTVAGVTFTLDCDAPVLEWLYPDGSRTNVMGHTVQEARRAMMFGAVGLADAWKAAH